MMPISTIELPIRRVTKKGGGYVVIELVGSTYVDDWKEVSKVYGHSTSAFAALGRLTQKDTIQA
jgi:hypothetical protein